MMSIGKMIVSSILENVGKRLWGFKPNLMRDLVAQHGGRSSLKWFISNMAIFDKILKRLGPIRTHFLATEISSINGCPYCVFGHGYALQLHYFKKTDRLLEVDEVAMQQFCFLDRADTLKEFRSILAADEFELERNDLENMIALWDKKKTPQTQEDDDSLNLIRILRHLNVCGINGNTLNDQAHDPINKDEDLKRTYHERRKAV